MKPGFIVIGVAGLLASCGGGKVSENQCNEILKQEIKVAMQAMVRPGGSVDDFLGAAKYGDPRSCAAGTTRYQRSDYECVVAAKTDDETKACLDKAHQRIDGSSGR